MNGLPYYPRYPRDFFDGTNGMTFELKGAYSMLLDLIYMSGGRLYDEPRFIAGHMNCSVRAWNGYRSALLAMSKIRIENEIISNFRADKEMIIQRSFRDKQRENGSSPKKNNSLAEAVAKPKVSHTDTDTDTDKKEKDTSVSLAASNEIQAAVDAYNSAASQSGWPSVQRLTDPRKALLRGRLSDAGGIDGWRAAMARASASDFLCGRINSRDGPFIASFDWIAKAANFTKIMEGNYDNRARNQSSAFGAFDEIAAAARAR